MTEVTRTSTRKSDHIRINLDEDVQSGISTGLERIHFIHQGLPEIDLDQVDLSQTLFGKKVRLPLLISSMTGGTREAEAINQHLATAAQEFGMAMGLGSQRAALEDPSLIATFQVRRQAPDILLFANLGAIQLNYGYTVDECRKAVAIAGADALILHLNSLQEALQPEGNTRFSGLLGKIEAVCRSIEVPVIVKEVGWGISEKTAAQLASAGVSAIDVAGAGGTSWSQVEMYRGENDSQKRVAAAFRDWGIPTADSIQMVRKATPDMIIFASGGLRDGVDIAKCIALGARLGGMARPFLVAANQSYGRLVEAIGEIEREIRICMFATGCGTLSQLSQSPVVETLG